MTVVVTVAAEGEIVQQWVAVVSGSNSCGSCRSSGTCSGIVWGK